MGDFAPCLDLLTFYILKIKLDFYFTKVNKKNLFNFNAPRRKYKNKQTKFYVHSFVGFISCFSCPKLFPIDKAPRRILNILGSDKIPQLNEGWKLIKNSAREETRFNFRSSYVEKPMTLL